MKQYLTALAARIDALSLRERAMVFAAAAAAILFVVWSIMLGPLFDRQKTLRMQLDQARNNIGGIDAEITAKVQGFAADPDAANRERLARIKATSTRSATNCARWSKGWWPRNGWHRCLKPFLRRTGSCRWCRCGPCR
ncbi:type II secretion system protein GspM [Massilia cavernae]|uniref:Type II secretion system protein M n=1 Tax=Massilia cavernae TaxID=2320864 RepID=A0A418Y7H3_9BURK|nr:type II secretion system protein GspM [Massilia cavernae]RJG25828.1 hypothetical protein D3872_02695 [Massilia cavernae]